MIGEHREAVLTNDVKGRVEQRNATYIGRGLCQQSQRIIACRITHQLFQRRIPIDELSVVSQRKLTAALQLTRS